METEIVNIVGKHGNLGTQFSTFFSGKTQKNTQNSEKYPEGQGFENAQKSKKFQKIQKYTFKNPEKYCQDEYEKSEEKTLKSRKDIPKIRKNTGET